MKKLLMLSKESVFSGYVKCGMAELSDSLANSLTENYEVFLIVANGHSRLPSITGQVSELEPGVQNIKFAKVNYFIIDLELWPEKPVELINKIQPDIFHNLDDPSILSLISYKIPKTICTFDSMEFANEHSEYFSLYDNITTNSQTMARSILRQRSNLSNSLSNTNFSGVAPGILTEFFTPEKGLLIPAAYNSKNLLGKSFCKQRLTDAYGLSKNPFICLTMCRLVKEKGLDAIIENIPFIKEKGGILIVVGKGDPYYEKQLAKFTQKDGLIYIPSWASYLQMPPFLAGADFYLQPSLIENGGLMPLTAMSYGTIPIITLNGGLLDNFNDDNAIIVYDDTGLKDAITRAADLYNDKQAFNNKKVHCMQQDISWNSRKENYIALYES